MLSSKDAPPLSYAECVRRVIRAAKAPLPFHEIMSGVARLRPIASRHPEQSIRNALAQTRQIVHTGEGYWYLPYLLKGNVFRLPLTSETLRSGTLILTPEGMCALWPSFYESGSLRDKRPPRIELEGGGIFKQPIERIQDVEWGWKNSRDLREWLRARRAKQGYALILTVKNAQARRYTLRIEEWSQRDAECIAERNHALLEEAFRVWRATPGGAAIWDLVPRLVARGLYRDACPPDPLLPMLDDDPRMQVYRPQALEPLDPAELREFAEDLLEEGLAWLDAGNIRQAEKSFQESMRADPSFADGLYHLGLIAHERGEWRRAEEYYRAALETASKEFDLKSRRLSWWGMIETRPLMRALHGLGLVLWKQRKVSAAIEIFEQMMQMNPNDNQGVRYLIGALYHQLGERDQAQQWYRKTADDVHVLFNWALLCWESGEQQDAVTHLLQGIVENPYLAPRLLGETPRRYTFWHASNREEPEYADDYLDLYGAMWRRQRGALKFLQQVWKHPRTRAYLAEFVELRQQLTREKDSSKRTPIVDAEFRLRRASVARPVARAIAHDLSVIKST